MCVIREENSLLIRMRSTAKLGLLDFSNEEDVVAADENLPKLALEVLAEPLSRVL